MKKKTKNKDGVIIGTQYLYILKKNSDFDITSTQNTRTQKKTEDK